MSASIGDRGGRPVAECHARRTEQQEPRWIPYFDAADADDIAARVQANGGSVLMPAADVPDVGRIAWLADPFGAPFAVLKPSPRAA